MTSMRERCLACAAKHTRPEWKITYRKALTGVAWPLVGEMKAPMPVTRKALYIYLHECAHLVLMHIGRKPSHVQEMEAEKQAHKWMREAGIPVPRSMTRRARNYVDRKIHQAIKHGAKRIDPEAARYARFTSVQRYMNYVEPTEIEGFKFSAAQHSQLDIFEFWVIRRFECQGKRFWRLVASGDANGDWPIEVQAATIPQVVALAKARLH